MQLGVKYSCNKAIKVFAYLVSKRGNGEMKDISTNNDSSRKSFEEYSTILLTQ